MYFLPLSFYLKKKIKFIMYQSGSTICIFFLNTLVVFHFLLYHGKHVEARGLCPRLPDKAVWVRVLVGDIVLRSWARHFTLTVLLSNQVCKRVLAKDYNLLVLVNFVLYHCDILASLSERSRNTLSYFNSATETGEKRRPSCRWATWLARGLNLFTLIENIAPLRSSVSCGAAQKKKNGKVK